MTGNRGDAPGSLVVPDEDLSADLRGLFPDCPALRAVAITRVPDLTSPFPGEEPDHAMAAARRREFRAGRACARLALELVGAEPGPIPIGGAGEPVWPRGYCGSIAHSEHLVAAAAMPSRGRVGVGIDLESRGNPDERTARIFCTRRERGWIETAGAPPAPLPGWAVLFFCVKEAVFKAQPAALTTEFGLGDFSVVLDLSAGAFSVVDSTAGPYRRDLLETRGRFLARSGHVLAGAVRGTP